LFNSVKFIKPKAAPYAVRTNMTATVDGVPSASFALASIIEPTLKVNKPELVEIPHKEVLKLSHKKAAMIEFKPVFNIKKEVACN